MSNCKDCLFWKPQNEFNKKGECGELSDKPFGSKDGLEMEVRKVITGPNFGCIHGRYKKNYILFFKKENKEKCVDGAHKYKPTHNTKMGFQIWICEHCNFETLSV